MTDDVDATDGREPVAPLPKVDPETLVLRARPARSIRFKRGAVVAIAALGSAGIIATTWVALRPAALHLAVEPEDRGIAARPPGDTLSTLPATYGDAPRLGPPLPGDLGRPILDHQRTMAADLGAMESQRAAQAEAEGQRRVAELRAARESALLFQSANDAAAANQPPATSNVASAPTEASRLAIDADRDPKAQQRKADFVRATDKTAGVNPHALTPAASPYLLSAGSVIAASLVTGIRSDLPGLVIAQVTQRVFDSATGRIELVPQGARLIGAYDSVVAFGQRRALVVWQRIVLPDGSSLTLDNVPATDPAGYSGLADKVDFHTWALLKGVALSTLLGVGSSLTFTGESDFVQAIRESTLQNVSRAGDQLTSKNLQVQPTIAVRPGTAVRLIVQHDLVLAPWRE